MKDTEGCECCGLVVQEERMYDDYICIYCHSDADREDIISDFRKVYTRFSRYVPQKVRREVFEKAEGICQYCLLNEATQVDHILPYSFLPDHSPENLIASCQSCNCIAGNKMFKSIEEKRRHIIRRLCGKMRRVPIWTKEEVSELTGNLKTMRRIVVANDRERKAMAEFIESIGLVPIV